MDLFDKFPKGDVHISLEGKAGTIEDLLEKFMPFIKKLVGETGISVSIDSIRTPEDNKDAD